MTPLAHFFARVEATAIAAAIGQSTLLNGTLSGIHLLGLTLIVGSVFVSSLRLLGILLPGHPVHEVTGAARRGIVVGLAVSVVSGLLLFAPRASIASEVGFFQLKMLLLSAAGAFHFAVYRKATEGDRVVGAVGLILWISVAVAGCAYILLE